MAFLKETERSLRLYFIIVGILGTLIGLSGLGTASREAPSGAPMLVTLAIWLPPLARLVLGPLFVAAGINLRRALERGAAGTRKLVMISAAVVVGESILIAAVLNSVEGNGDSSELMGRAFGRSLIPLLILWYIHASLRRLATESQRRIVDTVARKFE